MKKGRIEKTLDGREVIVLSARQYNKWEKEHLEELLPRQELEMLKRIEAERKSMPFMKRLIMDIKQRFRAILSRFYLMRRGNGRV